MPGFDYDLFVIGGGSGGVRAARLAASLGKRVAIAEEYRFGGTCVIRGCVPKKLLVYASQYQEHFEDAAGFGWDVGPARLDWPRLTAARNAEVSRLESLYRKGLDASGAERIESRAELLGPHEVRIVADGRVVTAERILVATGAAPNRHPALPGHALCITSNEAFELETLPASMVILGGGYIAVELAGLLQALGSRVTLLVRGERLRFAANGREVFDFADKPELLKSGPIGLQLHSNDQPQEYFFRSLLLSENPGENLVTVPQP